MEYYYVKKELSESDCSSKLALPSKWVGPGRLLPAPAPGSESEPVAIPAKDESGREYTFMLKVRSPQEPHRRGGGGGVRRRYYRKPEFRRREWHAFVLEKGLNVGDRIYFWWDTRGYLRVKARVPPRPYRLFGNSFLY